MLRPPPPPHCSNHHLNFVYASTPSSTSTDKKPTVRCDRPGDGKRFSVCDQIAKAIAKTKAGSIFKKNPKPTSLHSCLQSSRLRMCTLIKQVSREKGAGNG